MKTRTLLRRGTKGLHGLKLKLCDYRAALSKEPDLYEQAGI